MRKRRPSERRILFPWEKRAPVVTWVSRQRAAFAVVLGAAGLGLWGLGAIEARHRATFDTRAAIASVLHAVEAFRADQRRCPANLAELSHPPDGFAPYLAEVPLDGWGRPLRMECPGRKNPALADVVSGGPSGTFLDTDQVE